MLFSVQNASVPKNLLTLSENYFAEQENRSLLALRVQLSELLSDPLLNGIEIEPVIVEGEPAAEIARAVRDYDIDLVTVVTHGRKGLSRALWGSTAEEIIAEAPCPVLTIRPSQHDFVEHCGTYSEIHLKRMLLATNFRPSSAAATQVAHQLANRTGAELHMVYVIVDFMDQFSVLFPEGGLNALSQLRKYVQDKMALLRREADRPAIPHIAEGRPYEAIVKLALEESADLIVIGTNIHASLFGGTPVLGAEIERVVRNSPCPVLCVPSARVLTPLGARITVPVPQT